MSNLKKISKYQHKLLLLDLLAGGVALMMDHVDEWSVFPYNSGTGVSSPTAATPAKAVNAAWEEWLLPGTIHERMCGGGGGRTIERTNSNWVEIKTCCKGKCAEDFFGKWDQLVRNILACEASGTMYGSEPMGAKPFERGSSF
jgi:hypothetical protein